MTLSHRIAVVVFACFVAKAPTAASAAGQITYVVTPQSAGGWTLKGSFQTDGTIGLLTTTNIVSSDVVITNGTTAYALGVPTDGALCHFNNWALATKSSVTIPITGGGPALDWCSDQTGTSPGVRISQGGSDFGTIYFFAGGGRLAEGLGAVMPLATANKASLQITSTANQIGIAGRLLSVPLEVQVLDESSRPPTTPVHAVFTVSRQPDGAGASLKPAEFDDTTGKSWTQLTLGSKLGVYEVTATACIGTPCTLATVTFRARTLGTLTLLDPVPTLLGQGPAVIEDPTILAAQAPSARLVQGVAADGTAQIVIQIGGASANENLKVTLLPFGDGSLAAVGGAFQIAPLSIQADGTGKAFAIYRAPDDFVQANDLDNSLASRSVEIKVESMDDPAFSLHASIAVVRPLVALVHGQWSNARDTWGAFLPFSTNGLFTIETLDYDSAVAVGNSIPETYYQLRGSALGLDFNAPRVLARLTTELERYRAGHNRAGVPVAAVQADVIAHSLGGLISRRLATEPGYRNAQTFGAGLIHKLITIDTPHLGTPVALEILRTENSCVRQALAKWGDSPAVVSAATARGRFSGSTSDLQGHGVVDDLLSQAIKQLRQGTSVPLRTAMIAAWADADNLRGVSVNSNNVVGAVVLAYLFLYCKTSPLVKYLDPEKWNTLFMPWELNGRNDGSVGLTSQRNGDDVTSISAPGGTVTNVFSGCIHSAGTKKLGFFGPTVLDNAKFSGCKPLAIQDTVIRLLNTPRNDTANYQDVR